MRTFVSAELVPFLREHAAEVALVHERVESQRRWSEVSVLGRWRALPVVYLFSGMDLVNALGLFPLAPSYSLVAPFASGDVDCLRDIKCASLAAGVAKKWFEHAVDRRWRTTNTRLMETLFGSTSCGVLPALLLCLELVGCDVVSSTTTVGGARRVVARKRSDGRCFEVTYLSAWLEPASLPSVAQQLWGADAPNSSSGVAFVLKAAPYEVIREQWFAEGVLSKAALVMGDETGLRPSAYDRKSWLLTPWGGDASGRYNPLRPTTTQRMTAKFPEDSAEFEALYASKAPALQSPSSSLAASDATTQRAAERLPFAISYFHEKGSAHDAADRDNPGYWVVAQREGPLMRQRDDVKARDALPARFVLLTTQHSGSSWLVDQLDASPKIRCGFEELIALSKLSGDERRAVPWM